MGRNRISIEPVHGMQGGTETRCIHCGSNYVLIDYADATDHATGKVYSFAIENCDCGRIRNKDDLRKNLPPEVFNAIMDGIIKV